VIHLACISNDPSFELNPDLGKSINLDPFEPLVLSAKAAGVSRFIYASSSSVYGIKEETDVHEEMSLEPLTDYSRFKAECEVILNSHVNSLFTGVTVRPATVCGYARRQRLDVVVNILTNQAYHTRKVAVLGGAQLRPNIHISDMVRSYFFLLDAGSELVNGQIFNAGDENKSVMELAKIVQEEVGSDVEIEVKPSTDNRSYHISSEKIRRVLGFSTVHSIREAVKDLKGALEGGRLPNSLTDDRFFNIKQMQKIGLE
jgi:nucleoside-diphosphate-sugar epimerase